MVTIIKAAKNNAQLLSTPEPGTWIYLFDPTDDEIAEISAKTALDSAHFFDVTSELKSIASTPDSAAVSIRLETPYIKTTDKHHSIYAIASTHVLVTSDYLITIVKEKDALLQNYINTYEKTEGFSTAQPFLLLLQMMQANCDLFFTYLRLIERSAERMEPALGKAMKNKELYEILQLSKSLSYYSMAFESNGIVYKGLAENSDIIDDGLYKTALYEVRDANRQLSTLARIQAEILSGTANIIAGMVSNNLNIVMKFMTAFTIIMTVPTILASLWGMNFPGLPFGNSSSGFYIVLGITIVISTIVAIIFKKKDMF